MRECGERDADQAQPDGGDRWFEVVRKIIDDENNDWWKAPEDAHRRRRPRPATSCSRAP